ncbi:hypothetical protein AAFN47_10365 [Hoeflea sp. CAU 1731]
MLPVAFFPPDGDIGVEHESKPSVEAERSLHLLESSSLDATDGIAPLQFLVTLVAAGASLLAAVQCPQGYSGGQSLDRNLSVALLQQVCFAFCALFAYCAALERRRQLSARNSP